MASLTVKLHATRNFQDLNSAPHGSRRQTKQSKNSSWKSNEGKFSSDPTPWARGRTKNWDIPIDFKCLPHTLLPSASEESQITWEPRCSSGRQIIPDARKIWYCPSYLCVSVSFMAFSRVLIKTCIRTDYLVNDFEFNLHWI